DASGLPTRVAVAPGEEPLAAAVETAAAGAARAVPAPDLPSLVALSRAARLFLGGDTGPTHLAHALGTPVFMVMGPTHPERHGPYGAPERALRQALLRDLPPERVAERALESLRQVAPRGAC
ncbi:MAG TPA: glycosyltransferase family 9 protein, partial [Thermoanaerobaculia bacterium]|nr:glycosyltransferase family 9 protein [Thermoanaerobaculia bacterium]